VLNQIDRVGLPAGLERDEYGRISKVRVSAKTGEGLEMVRSALIEHYQYLLSHISVPQLDSSIVA
jgi:GTP-binding protein HflX